MAPTARKTHKQPSKLDMYSLGAPWFLWSIPIPSTTMLAAGGTVVAVFTGPIEYGEELAALLGRISGLPPSTP